MEFFFSSSLIAAFRPLNLFLIVLTQTLSSVFLLNHSLCISKLFNQNQYINFYLIVLATVLSAAGGYILNDCFDRKIDAINTPERSQFTEKNLSLLYFFSFILFGVSIFIGFVINLKIGFSVLLSILILIFYAKYSKKVGILKPILVSFLTAFSIFIVSILESSIPVSIYFFSLWAFFLSMLREIVKDLEDWKGDVFQNSFTSAIQLGKQKSHWFLYILSTLLIFSILLSIFFVPNTVSNTTHKIIMISLILFFMIKLNNAHSVSYKKLSLFCKIMMLVGILGMVVY
ncbi:geranylgeranylglycerol-phosphate geranylgeranyltransferase [Bernardetia sp.]|uniref:geranylgeranylglycerol-phosphate geranylgeranyltransferase n=1 Tax=Bernardetia sp. TaxID=1937974 RepID=UPI0025BB2637|nr:geranylgeranylglycerol-phosphate geranylgeranyltransferase [Bernardetia sp.]